MRVDMLYRGWISEAILSNLYLLANQLLEACRYKLAHTTDLGASI
jgi:hypothetical protein